jgi:hypothetical protein
MLALLLLSGRFCHCQGNGMWLGCQRHSRLEASCKEADGVSIKQSAASHDGRDSSRLTRRGHSRSGFYTESWGGLDSRCVTPRKMHIVVLIWVQCRRVPLLAWSRFFHAFLGGERCMCSVCVYVVVVVLVMVGGGSSWVFGAPTTTALSSRLAKLYLAWSWISSPSIGSGCRFSGTARKAQVHCG